ncbi:MAG: hypothetical protein K2J90_07860 [Lachnospiraceae bacterium]|nr:hypothetical protein [Lachnospiraceae bacterium]
MKAGDIIDIYNDELKIYRGENLTISEYISIHQPTLSEICDYGERDYYSMIYQLTATPQSMKWQLWDAGIDYTEMTPFELFCAVLHKLYPQEKTSILFGTLDFTKFEIRQRKEDNSIFLYQEITVPDDNSKTNSIPGIHTLKNNIDYKHEDVIIDEFTYNMIMDYLRQMHDIKKDEKKPANESTKMILIEDAREEYERNKNKEYHSQLKNLISAMINSEGFKYDHSQVWDMTINAFMDSVKRISKIKNAEILLNSGYSGYGISLKDVDNKQLDWLGEL